MNRLCVSLVLSLALAAAGAPALRAQQSQATKAKKEKKIWTNDDLDQLQDKGRVSVLGETPAEAPAAAGGQPAAIPADKSAEKTEPYMKEKDAKWYADQIGKLRTELERLDAETRRLRDFRSSAKGAMSGLVLGQPNASLTPENQIEQLEARRREVRRQIDDLEDQARRSDIAPGAVR